MEAGFGKNGQTTEGGALKNQVLFGVHKFCIKDACM